MINEYPVYKNKIWYKVAINVQQVTGTYEHGEYGSQDRSSVKISTFLCIDF